MQWNLVSKIKANLLMIGNQYYGVIKVINKSGSSIDAGKICHLSGFDATAKLPKIVLSDADYPQKPAQFITKDAIPNNSIGFVYEKLEVGLLNTNSGEVGDPVYLSSTAGGWSLSAPIGADQITQIVGIITVKSATVGKILFLINPKNMYGFGTSSIADSSITNAKLAGSITNAKLAGGITHEKLSGGFSKVSVVDGTAAATDVTITGMASGDELVSVLALTTKASIASLANRTSEYTVGSGKIVKAAGTDETDNQLIVIWNDLT